MSVELRAIRGPLDEHQLSWLAELYGPVDPNYRSLGYLRHQFVENPFGWSVHVFAIADDAAVGHCGAVPFRGRLGSEMFTVGKLEALVVAPTHRGGTLAVEILQTLYAFAHEHGIDVLFGFAPPRVAAVHVRAGCRLVPLDAPAWVLVSSPTAFAEPRRRLAGRLLYLAQNAVLGATWLATRVVTGTWLPPAVGPVGADDAALVRADAAPGDWTVSGADAWDWYAGSGVLQAIEIPGRFGSRAVVRIHEGPAQIVAWRPRRAGLAPGILLLGAAAALARSRGAPTLRFQPWRGGGGDGGLGRVCAALGWIRRNSFEVLLHSTGPEPELRLTPFLYVTF